ncbi:MAG: NAD-dependent epimerase/dehydratase family protein, partial [Chloroflexota bacterium]|nr:NAD-dependent epimerase/dehydratase family protein [Chloroflexota bacterium]
MVETDPNTQPAATMLPQTFLITGGAGFLGINLIRYLLAHGHHIVSLDIADFTYPERDQVTILQGDIRNPDDVARAVQGVDVVIHTAAALPLYSAADIYSTDIDGIRTVLQAAYAAQVARVVHISSTAVYGIPDHHPLYETDKL